MGGKIQHFHKRSRSTTSRNANFDVDFVAGFFFRRDLITSQADPEKPFVYVCEYVPDDRLSLLRIAIYHG